MARRHLVARTACAVALLVAVCGTAVGISAQEGGAWGARPAPVIGSGHWSIKPADTPPVSAPAPEQEKKQAAKAVAPKVESAAAAVAPPARHTAPRATKSSTAPTAHPASNDAPGRFHAPAEVALEWPEDLAAHVAPVAPTTQVAHGPRHIELLWEATPSIATAAPKPQVSASSAPRPAAGTETSKPAPTGLERLSADWPSWARVSVQYRGRTEYAEPLAPASVGKDGYYLNRFRLQGTFVPASWLQFVVQAQDSQVLGYNVTPISKFANTVDLRLGYAEVTVPGIHPLTVRGGRQEIAFGDGRLLATPDWGNTNRAFDGVRVSTKTQVGKLDLFAASPVVITLGDFDKWKKGEWIYGAYTSVENVVPRTVLEPYAFVRTQQDVPSEAKVLGDARLVTVGSRAVVKVRKTIEANGEGAVQRGEVSGDTVEAWAAHAAVAWTPARAAMKPKVSAEYNFASGDTSPTDGRRGTFDQLYASNHNRYGLIDAVGWRNIHHAGSMVEASPARKVKAGAGVHYFALATLADGVYSASGSRVILNRKATSRSIGWETDGWVSYAISKELSVAGGLGVLFAGEYLQQSSTFDRLWSPYLAWNFKF